jgi:hypothetical protein
MMSKLTAKQEAFAQAAIDGAGPFYVYALFDGRNNEMFYVGKGRDNRLHQHVKDARNGRICNDAKHQRICEIIESGNRVVSEIIIGDLTEDASLKIERYLIEQYRQTLTNIVKGSSPRGSVVVREAAKLIAEMPPKNLWIAGWHPDCIKGFGGLEEAAAFYDVMMDGLKGIVQKAPQYA